MSSPSCDCGEANDNVQDEQHASSILNTSECSLFAEYTPTMFSQAGSLGAPAFLNQNGSKLPVSLHELLACYKQASSRTSGPKAFSL